MNWKNMDLERMEGSEKKEKLSRDNVFFFYWGLPKTGMSIVDVNVDMPLNYVFL